MKVFHTATGEVTESLRSSIPTRSEVPVEDTWDLSPLFAFEEDWDEAFREVSEKFPKILEWQGKIAEGAEVLAEVLEFEKELNLELERIAQYASLRTAEDGANPESLAREARLQSLFTKIAESQAFLAPEIQAIDDETFAAFLAHPSLEEWTIPLQKLRRYKPHTLSFPEERLLALGASAIAGHQETFSQLTNVDMKFGAVRTSSGEEIELSQSAFSSMLVRKDPALRKDSFHRFYEEFSDHRHTLASSLASSVRAGVFYARARNHPSALEAALFSDDVPVSVYNNLISTVHSRLEPLFRYLRLRKKVLGLEEIHHYDTYVPLVAEIDTDIPWDDAVEKVLAAVQPLGPEYTEALGAGLREGRWCDRYENKGKQSGAFSSGSYQSPPYILMNYKRDVFSDVFTLAHEAGHSMHTWFSRREQSFQNYHYPIFLAEVASTFNEILLTEHLLAQTEDPAMRAYLINREIDDFRGTLYRQTMFAEFEKAIHELEEAGEPLTLETFRTTYRGLLDMFFGDTVVIDPELELECLRIPHFYRAFYVYKYATGLSAAVALARKVTASGDPSGYLDFLRSGGSKYPLEALELAGVDMRSPAPIEAALDWFAQRVEELETLLG